MPIIIDIVEGAELDHAVAGSTMVRIAHVYGLDSIAGGAAQPGDPSMLFRALADAGLPQWFDVHPSAPAYVCNRHVITPQGDSSCEIKIYYVTGPGSPPPSTWVVTETTSPMQVTTQLHPGSGNPMTINYKVAGTGGTYTGGFGTTGGTPPQIFTDVCTFVYDISVRRLTFEGWVSRSMASGNSTPTGQANTEIYAGNVNSVNAEPWRGYGIGYWRFHEWYDQTQDRGFSYTIRASFITKMREDWSQWQVLRVANTGKLVAPDAADIARLKALPYDYSWHQGNGIVKAGLYPLIDFIPLFGT